MNTLTMSLFFMGLGILGPDVQAAPFDHPCEVLYWKMNREEDASQRDLLERRFSTCVDQFGETKLIKEAKDYLRESNDYAVEVEKKIEEQAKIARGERAGKIVKEISEEEISNHENNPLGSPLVSEAIIYEGRKPKTHETSADAACKYLGYDKSTSSTQSRSFDNGSYKDREVMPEEVLELRKGGFFNGYKTEPIVHRARRHNELDYGIAFRYFTSLTCEREVKEGESIQNFDLDMDEIGRAVRSQMDPPQLDDEVARILSLNRTNDKVIGEDLFQDEDDDKFRPTRWEENPFIHSSSIRQ